MIPGLRSPTLIKVSVKHFKLRVWLQIILKVVYIRHSAALLGINLLIDTTHTIYDYPVPILDIQH